MSRIYEGDDEDFPNQWALMDQATKMAMNGRRGQFALKELETALVTLPSKALVDDVLGGDGAVVCALGACLLKKKMDRGATYEEAMIWVREIGQKFKDDSSGGVKFSRKFLGITYSLAWRIVYKNDESFGGKTPEERYTLMLEWVRSNIQDYQGGKKPDDKD